MPQGNKDVPELACSGPDETKIAEKHVSVMLHEVLEGLVINPGGRFMDGTLGLGGHASAILERAGSSAELLGLDRDEEALALAAQRLKGFGDAAHFAQSCFADFEQHLDALGWEALDGVLVDLGVSSLQLDSPERGFSFIADGPLDMRMDQGSGESAADLVARLSVQALKDLIQIYGEDPMAGRIARGIDDARASKPIETTSELAAIVEKAYPAKWRAKSRNHPATRTFQALRMVVNGELDQLKLFLERIVPRLAVGGRVAVISFHSLEDRIVKHFFRSAATACICPPYLARCACSHEASLSIVTRKALLPGEDEVAANPRARSAKLRIAERTEGKFSKIAESPLEGGSSKRFSHAGKAGAARGRGSARRK